MGHYEELGVEPSATDAEIRRAYLDLARRHHPDRLGAAGADERGRAETRMARINEAWTVLSDVDRRARYDLEHFGESAAHDGRIHDVDRTFRPFDGGDDPDPLDLDDTPIGPPTLTRRATMVPAWLGIAAFGALAVGGLGGLAPVFVLGLALAVCSALSFLVLPLVALARSARRDEL